MSQKIVFKQKYLPAQDDVKKVFQHANTEQECLLVLFAYQNGLTPSDIAGLCVGRYPLEPWQPYAVIRPMNKKVWYSVSTPEIVQYMQAYLTVRGGAKGDPLFVNKKGAGLDGRAVSRIISTIIKRANVGEWAGFSCRLLRDGFYDVLCEAGVCRFWRDAIIGYDTTVWHHWELAGVKAKKLDDLVIIMKNVYPFVELSKVV
ncbi:MAG: hypothetical protein FWD52_04750 [Candidatus Bathyarchaeota archaeon]|nr:hypothetical protein [Candidatus Termiticorpusculum sp.]